MQKQNLSYSISQMINKLYFYFPDNARTKNSDVVSRSIGYFTRHAPRIEISHPPPVNLRYTLDEVHKCMHAPSVN